jgi:hypothetical protein
LSRRASFVFGARCNGGKAYADRTSRLRALEKGGGELAVPGHGHAVIVCDGRVEEALGMFRITAAASLEEPCLGAALARVTVEECLRTVLAADDWYELMEAPDKIPWRSAVGRSPARLFVTPVAG